jgi:signal peptidase II
LLIILVISYYSFKNKPKNNIEKIAYSLVLGGAIGNFIDRIIYRGVIDFISVKIFGYDYPIFNLADSFIVIGVIILLIYTYKGDKRGDRSK